ncbi:hypothetical protein QQ045_031837 [Rhodiola kirilowii]
MRVELVQRKRKATERILKKDLVDLLAAHLELDAYKRAEGLLAELTISSGYEFIEDSCNWLLRNMSSISKRKECPEKCKEAVASLMFAASWFSDLPELRDLRDIFYSRYGKSMEFYVNQKFAETLKSKGHYSMEKKVRLMEHVAAEFSVKWNSENFKQRICRDLVLVVKDHPMRHKFIDAPDRRRKEPKKPSDCSRKAHKHKVSEVKEKAIMSRVTWYSMLHHDKKFPAKYKPGAKYEHKDKREDAQPKKQIHYLVRHSRRGVRPSDDKLQTKLRSPARQCHCGFNKDLLPERSEPDTRRVIVPQQQGVLADEAKHSKKLNDPNIIERKLGYSKRDAMTLQISIQEVNEEEEERIIDKLLIKYSRNPHSPEKMRIESKGQPSNQTLSDGGNADDKLDLVPFTTRSKSLPKKQTGPTEQEKALIRISSCQTNRLAPHVHPKLPDYDELAAKFAALKQRQGP